MGRRGGMGRDGVGRRDRLDGDEECVWRWRVEMESGDTSINLVLSISVSSSSDLNLRIVP